MAYKNPEDRRAYARKWREKNRDKVKADNRERMRRWRAEHGKEQRQRMKDACFGAYGGYICACCGETEKLFLTLDHINNDGAAQRRQGLRGHTLWQWIISNNFPPIFQVLCSNCNLGKHLNNGICPHKSRRASQ